jgi:hypothetical protein
MSQHATVTETPAQQAPPPFDPDPELIAHLEGNALELRGYRKDAERLRREAQQERATHG